MSRQRAAPSTDQSRNSKFGRFSGGLQCQEPPWAKWTETFRPTEPMAANGTAAIGECCQRHGANGALAQGSTFISTLDICSTQRISHQLESMLNFTSGQSYVGYSITVLTPARPSKKRENEAKWSHFVLYRSPAAPPSHSHLLTGLSTAVRGSSPPIIRGREGGRVHLRFRESERDNRLIGGATGPTSECQLQQPVRAAFAGMMRLLVLPAFFLLLHRAPAPFADAFDATPVLIGGGRKVHRSNYSNTSFLSKLSGADEHGQNYHPRPPPPEDAIAANALLSQAHELLTVAQLRELLRRNNAKVSGKKRELVDRLGEILVRRKEVAANHVVQTQNNKSV